MDDDSEHKKAKETKKNIIKRELVFKSYTDCLFNDKTEIESNCHNVYTEQIKKIAQSSNDYKRLQTFGKITTYGTNAFKVCKSEMLSKYK